MDTQDEPRIYTETSPFAAHNGIVITEIGDECATGYMTVTENHLNSVGMVHGGAYFAFADAVFGAATRYIDTLMVTLDTTIEYVAPAKLGDTLWCTCREVASSRKIPHHQAEVRDQDGKLLCLVHVTGYRRKPKVD